MDHQSRGEKNREKEPCATKFALCGMGGTAKCFIAICDVQGDPVTDICFLFDGLG